jgi:hypothetical protein
MVKSPSAVGKRDETSFFTRPKVIEAVAVEIRLGE